MKTKKKLPQEAIAYKKQINTHIAILKRDTNYQKVCMRNDAELMKVLRQCNVLREQRIKLNNESIGIAKQGLENYIKSL